MRRFFFPIKDVSLYEQYETRQAGLDEILDVGKGGEGTYSIRSLIQFDIESISASLASGDVSPSSSFDLKLFVAESSRLIVNQQLDVHMVSQSWEEGQGYFYQEPYTEDEGAKWSFKSSGSRWAESGSAYIASPSASSVATSPLTDFEFDVTSMIQSLVSGSIPNYGFVVKFPDWGEASLSNDGLISFFSRNSHTVYPPVLIAKWDNQTYSTGSSLSAAPTTDLLVFPKNLKKSYKQNEIVRVDLISRKRYPVKSFSTTFEEWSNTALPTTSYFSIVDSLSKEIIVPFDDYSKISADSNGSYFTFKVEKMFPLRHYNILIKVVTEGYEYIFEDSKYNFMVTK